MNYKNIVLMEYPPNITNNKQVPKYNRREKVRTNNNETTDYNTFSKTSSELYILLKRGSRYQR